MVNNDKANKSLDDTDKRADKTGKTFGSLIATGAKVGAGILAGAAVAGGAMLGLATKAGNAADRLLDLSSITGMTTDEIQKWERVTTVAGVSLDTVTNASQKFTKSLDVMGEESNKGRAALGELGMSLEQVKGMNADQRMDAIVESLGKIEDPTERARLGTDLLGGSWKEIAPILDVGADRLKDVKDNANIISEEDLNKANEFRIKMDTMKEKAGVLGMELGVKLIPVFDKFFAWIEKYIPIIEEKTDLAFKVIGEAIVKVGTAVTKTKEFFTDHWEVLAPILAGVAAGAITFGVITLATKAWTAATKLVTAAQAALSLVMNLSPMGKVILLVGLLVAAGVALYQNWDTVKEKASDLWFAIKNAFRKGVNGAIGFINNLIKQINKIPGVDAPLIARVELRTTDNSKAKTMDDRLGNSGYKPGNNAQGTDYWRGGLTWVGEEGPEIVRLPRGSQVIPNDKAMAGGGITLYIQNLYNNRKQDVEELAQELEMYRQMHSKALGGGA